MEYLRGVAADHGEIWELLLELFIFLNEIDVLAYDWEYSVDKEAVNEIRHCLAKEVFRCCVVRVADDPREEVHIASSDSNANNHPCQLFPK